MVDQVTQPSMQNSMVWTIANANANALGIYNRKQPIKPLCLIWDAISVYGTMYDKNNNNNNKQYYSV